MQTITHVVIVYQEILLSGGLLRFISLVITLIKSCARTAQDLKNRFCYIGLLTSSMQGDRVKSDPMHLVFIKKFDIFI